MNWLQRVLTTREAAVFNGSCILVYTMVDSECPYRASITRKGCATNGTNTLTRERYYRGGIRCPGRISECSPQVDVRSKWVLAFEADLGSPCNSRSTHESIPHSLDQTIHLEPNYFRKQDISASQDSCSSPQLQRPTGTTGGYVVCGQLVWRSY